MALAICSTRVSILTSIILLFALFAGAAFATDLSSCQTISSSGSYVLTQDISTSGTCFTIAADNVILDCAGHSMTGDGSGNGIDNTAGHGYVTVKNCIITGFNTGIYFTAASYGTISNNNATSNGNAGIYLEYSSNYNTISNNNASSNYDGIYVSSSCSDNTINDNTFASNSGRGIVLYSNSDNTVANNTINSNDQGILLVFSSNNIINNNIASSNRDGIWLGYSSNNNTISNNNASSNNVGISLYSSSNNNTVANNTVNSNGGQGILIGSSSNNIISNNIASSNGDKGIYLESGSNNNTIANNTLNSNTGWGIYLGSSSSNTVSNNNASNSGYNGIALYYGSNYNNIANNTASSNSYGIYLISNSNNTVSNNTASSNNFGIRLESDSDNIVYNNRFNNSVNVYVDSPSFWNTTLDCSPGVSNILGGPCIGGNFWATPGGDGFSQTCTANTNGFCVSPSQYEIDSSNIDYLPLVMMAWCTDGETRPCPLQQGVCAGSYETCSDGAWPGCTVSNYGPNYEATETKCDNLDNDCNGVVDGMNQSCYTGPAGTLDIGICRGGTQTCSTGAWGGCAGQQLPIPENSVTTCWDSSDNNCNGLIDNADPNCSPGAAVLPSCTLEQMLDLNGDGSVTINDAIFIMRHIVGLPNAETVAKGCEAWSIAIE